MNGCEGEEPVAPWKHSGASVFATCTPETCAGGCGAWKRNLPTSHGTVSLATTTEYRPWDALTSRRRCVADADESRDVGGRIESALVRRITKVDDGIGVDLGPMYFRQKQTEQEQ